MPMAWVAVGSVAANSLANAGGGGVGADPNAMLRMSDPFSPYRGQYAAQLNTLMQDPSSITTSPMYKAGMQQGQDVLSRYMSAHGQSQSGQEQIALQNFGVNYQQQMFDAQFNRLAMLSGANQSPAVGAGMAMQASNTNMSNWSQLGGALGYGAGRYFGGGGGGGGTAGGVTYDPATGNYMTSSGQVYGMQTPSGFQTGSGYTGG